MILNTHRFSIRACLCLSTLCLSVQGQASTPSAPFSIKPRIVGGVESQECGWPTTVSIGSCTGTLLHPRVVVYAAHCRDQIKTVTLGADNRNPAREIKTTRCETYPNGGVQGNDYAYCLLAEEVTDVPIIPPAMGTDTLQIRKGQVVWAVGFGYYNESKQYGVKHEVDLKIRDFSGTNNSVIIAGGDGKDGCQGDSGGPLFMELPNGRGFRVVGVTSFGFDGTGSNASNLPCGYGGGWAMMHAQMAWLERRSGYDLTPCHDAQGNPDPDERCGIAPLQPSKASGSWASNCNWGPLSPANKNLPPAIRWADAVSQGARTPGEPYDIEVIANDNDDGEVRVELSVNGTSQPVKHKPPYRWSITLPKTDQLQLRAFAVDEQGLRSDARNLDLSLKTRSPTNSATPTSTAPSPEISTAGPDSTAPAQDLMPTPPEKAPSSCAVGQRPGAALTLALAGLLIFRRRKRSARGR